MDATMISLAHRHTSMFPPHIHAAPSRERAPRPLTLVVWALLAAAAALDAAGASLHPAGGQDRVLLYQDLGLLALWALAAPAIVGSARRFPVRGRADAGRVMLHLAMAAGFVGATNVFVRLPLVLAPWERGGAWLFADTLAGLARFGPVALLVYGVLLAAGQSTAGRQPAPIDDRASSSDATTAPEDQVPIAVADGDLPDEGASATPRPDRVVVRAWNRVHLVRPDDIDWVEADDNNVVVHTPARTYKGRGRISDLASQLDPATFVRIHRSAIVRVAAVREVQPLTKGDLAVVLLDGKVLRVARGRRAALEGSLGVTI